MRRPMQTHGEEKEGKCTICPTIFLKMRYDQKYCSRECYKKACKARSVPWVKRPNRDAMNVDRKNRYYLKRVATLQKQRDQRAADPEKYRALDRAAYQRNRAKKAASVNKYRAAHPEMRRKEYRTQKHKTPWARLLAHAKKRATKRGVPFSLTREWAVKAWTGSCAVTGIQFDFGTTKHYPKSPSIDRVDPTLGYEPSNCRFVIFAVNSLKGAGTDVEMVEVAKAIATKFP